MSIMTKHNKKQVGLLLEKLCPDWKYTDEQLDVWVLVDNRPFNKFVTCGDMNCGFILTNVAEEEKTLNIEACCVIPHFQNLGFERKLIEDIISQAKEKKMKKLIYNLKSGNTCTQIDAFTKAGFSANEEVLELDL